METDLWATLPEPLHVMKAEVVGRNGIFSVMGSSDSASLYVLPRSCSTQIWQKCERFLCQKALHPPLVYCKNVSSLKSQTCIWAVVCCRLGLHWTKQHISTWYLIHEDFRVIRVCVDAPLRQPLSREHYAWVTRLAGLCCLYTFLWSQSGIVEKVKSTHQCKH